MDFTGKVALITGGGGGIGRATALGFALRGAKVMVVDADASLGQASVDIIAQRGGAAAFVQADVTKSASVRDYVAKTLAAYGRIDAFFNNAGIEGVVTPTQEYDEEIFDKVIAVNLKGVFLGLRHVLPVMLKQGSGAIVNTASMAGLFGSPGMPAYVASKHGVLGLTKVASTDVAALGIRVNAVCPGPVETRMMRSLESQRNPNDPEAFMPPMPPAFRPGVMPSRRRSPARCCICAPTCRGTLRGRISSSTAADRARVAWRQ